MRLYQIDRLGENGLSECYEFIRAKNRVDAFKRYINFDEEEYELKITKDGNTLIIEEEAFSSAKWRVMLIHQGEKK